MQRPLLPILLAFIGGITAGAASGPPGLPVVAAFAGSVILFLVPAVKRRCIYAELCLLVAFFSFAFLITGHEVHKPPGPRDVSLLAGGERLTLEGLVVENPRILPDRADITVRVYSTVEGNATVPVEGLILLSTRDTANLPGYGDYIRFKAKLKEPRNFNNPGGFDYRRYLLGKGIRARGYLDKSGFIVIRSGGGNPLKARLEGYRNSLRKAIRENASSPEGEIIQAMVLGEQSEIPREVMDKFNRTGTSHVIAISGFNIGIIAAVSFFLARLVMKQSERLLLKFNILKISAVFSFIPVILFAFISGLGISVLRASLMVLAFLVAVCFGRGRDSFNVLALTALLILAVSPLALYDVSFQLSFVAVASILFMVPVFSLYLPDGKRISERQYPRLARAAAGGGLFLAVTLSATLGTAPLIIYHFNLLSLITIIANAVIVPIMGYLVIVLGMVIIVSTPLSSFLTASVVKIASSLTALSVWLADRLTHLPWAFTFVPTPTALELGAYYGLLFCAVQLLKERHRKDEGTVREVRRAPVALLSAFVSLILFFYAVDYIYFYNRDRHPDTLRVTVVDVGQGSSTLVDFPGGTKMLIDGGGFYDGSFDVGRYVLAPMLWHERVGRVDIAVLSHPHPDHLNGLLYILKNFRVKEVWTNGDEGDPDTYEEFKRIIAEQNIHHRVLKGRSRRHFNVGDSDVHVLNLRNCPEESDTFDLNDRSLVLKVTYGKTSFLIPGDISEAAEEELVRRNGPILRSQVLVAPHHGSARSSSQAFIKAVRPETVVFSSGAGNVFRLPHPDALARYNRIGCLIFRTDLNGAVTIQTDGQNVAARPFRGL